METIAILLLIIVLVVICNEIINHDKGLSNLELQLNKLRKEKQND